MACFRFSVERCHLQPNNLSKGVCDSFNHVKAKSHELTLNREVLTDFKIGEIDADFVLPWEPEVTTSERPNGRMLKYMENSHLFHKNKLNFKREKFVY